MIAPVASVAVAVAVAVVVAAAAAASAASCYQEALHQRLHLAVHHLLLAVVPEISRWVHCWSIAQSSFALEDFVNVVAERLESPPYSLTRPLIQQDFQTEDEIVSAADGYHP